MALPPPPPPLQIQCQRRGPILQWRSTAGYEQNRLTLSVPNLAPELQGLRLLHLSDLHAIGRWDEAYDELIASTQAKPPDLILFTGDFVDDKRDHRAALPIAQRLFSQLASRLGTFAVLGNHDGDLLAPKMADWNLHLLTRQRYVLHGERASVELIGVAGVDRYDFDAAWAGDIGPKREGSLRIVLSHFPDLLPRLRRLQSDLYLCGHTHGGQVALPFGRYPLIRHDTLPRRLCTGIHRAFGTVMITNRGLGFSSSLKLRLFCPTEVVEIVCVGSDSPAPVE